MKSILITTRSLIALAYHRNAALTVLGIALAIAFFATLVGIAIDVRVITGMPAWVKPAKFAVSTSIYCFTFVWLLGFVEGRQRFVRIVANITAFCLLVELVIIFVQAARGTTSHFNISTPLNAALWMTMGSFIVLLWLMTFALTMVLLRQRMPNRVFAWSLRLALVGSLLGMGVAFIMPSRPSPQQSAAIHAGHQPRTFGAHSVGVEDGGPGLPFVGWSTQGGDLRVAHFVGLHALQVLPFVGWLLISRGASTRLRESSRLGLVLATGVGYVGLIVLLTWQALRGQSVVRPDPITMAAFALLVAAVAVTAIASVVLPSRRSIVVTQAGAM